jgi:16S rRNA (guanine527-N7)-methyltransferase
LTAGKLQRLEAIAGPVSRETYDALLAFEATFLKWAARINLTSPSQLPELWDRHILDSAQLLGMGKSARLWVDFGTGGGFPGAILAILMRDRPGTRIRLVESNRKKVAFLQSALAGFDNAEILPFRIEDATEAIGGTDIITARALAPLPQLLLWSEPWLAKGARALFMKGQDFGVEVEESRAHWDFDLVEHRSRTNPEGVVLEISHLRPGKAGKESKKVRLARP